MAGFADLIRRPRGRPAPTLLAGTVLLLLAAGLLVAPTALPSVVTLALLAVAPLLAVAVHVVVERRSTPRRFGFAAPLPLFALVFVVILGGRAATLLAGEEGRYFVVGDRGASTEWKLTSALRTDAPERTVSPTVDALPSVEQEIGTSTTAAHAGREGWRWSFTTPARVGYVAASFPDPIASIEGGALLVVDGEPLGAAVAVRPTWTPGPTADVELYARFFDARGAHLDDVLVDRAPAASIGSARWTSLQGTLRAPVGARSVTSVVVVRDPPIGPSHQLDVDAALLVPGVESTSGLALYAPDAATNPWDEAMPRALSIALAMLLAVIGGYLLLPCRSRAPRRLPLRLIDTDRRRGRLVFLGLVAAGLAGWFWEMHGYGGYGGYLAGLDEIGVIGKGHWYQHALATVPTGLAIFLAANRLVVPGRRLRRWEIAVIVLGVAIGVSYFLKATIAIPLLTLLIIVSLRRPLAGAWLVAAGVVLALITPFVYAVRGSGRVDPGLLLSSSYWSDFIPNLTSRFFHFESLMVTVPHASSEAPWQPAADLIATAVPRAIWEGKPDSTAARFTQDHLLPGLHSPTDIGILSLPGEMYLVGGAAGILVVGVALGVLLRLCRELIAAHPDDVAALLLASSLLTWAVFLNDGWGLASAAVVVAIAQLGWLLLLRRRSRTSHDAGGSESRPPFEGADEPDGATAEPIVVSTGGRGA